MGFVQAPHTTYNLDNFMGRWNRLEGLLGRRPHLLRGRAIGQESISASPASAARRPSSAAKRIEDVGLFATETITEDMHTGMRINAAGWKSIAVSEEMVVGLAPDDAATFRQSTAALGRGQSERHGLRQSADDERA